MFPWPVFKVSGSRGRARAQETGTGRKIQADRCPGATTSRGPSSKAPRSPDRGQTRTLEERDLERDLEKGMALDLGAEGGDGMWGQADKTSKQDKKPPNTRNVRLASCCPELASHHCSQPTGSGLVCKPAASQQAWGAGGLLPPSASITGGRPGQNILTRAARPPHGTEEKAR